MRKSTWQISSKVLCLIFSIPCCIRAFQTSSVRRASSPYHKDHKSFIPKVTAIDQDFNEAGEIYVNGADHSVKASGPSALQSGVVTPYHLLYPDTFITTTIPFQRELPLYFCLQLFRKAIKASLIRDSEFDKSLDQAQQVLRIEHKISHEIDPLCWLQAQKKLNDHRQHPSIYFSTAEGTLEAAAFGSTIRYTGTTNEDEFWRIVQRLPISSYLYGGHRFDTESTISEEWKGFSKGFWMLPAVEIRKERTSVGSSSNETNPVSIAVHLVRDADGSFLQSARHVLDILSVLTDSSTPMTPPTTLPPVLSRTSTYGDNSNNNMDGQEIYEKGVMAALEEFNRPGSTLEKVVLARRMDLSFSRYASNNVDALDILRKWKFASQPGGHIFYLHPGGADSGEFFGCTPERLFRIRNGRVLSEALAGTRPRGSTPEADALLSRQLFESTKDQAENLITGNFIRDVFSSLQRQGYLKLSDSINGTDSMGGNFFVRRLRHLQHICQRYESLIREPTLVADVSRALLSKLHPTPAIGGFPGDEALEFIRQHETYAFDRGFYSGPVGFVGRDATELVVAIRSGLLTKSGDRPKLSVYAGAGIVPGSTVQGEWAETSYKLAVVSSIFPQSPITLQSAMTPNVAWASAFIEELIRNGITQFYICPGSRSTPLVAAIAKAVRSNVGIVHAFSIHDERGAAFRAVGYGRGAGRPAAVVTSSGTAVANLYPAVVEAGVDGVPMIVLTADRPYENRNTGANQAIDQVKIFSDSYLRWFRDILPPSDDVPVAVALADAAHAVTLARTLRGPVHLNIQFRENLAPDAGPIRNDDRNGAITKYDAIKFTECSGFQRWSLGGSRWLLSYSQEMKARYSAVSEIGNLISKSKRGIIVVGNLRKSDSNDGGHDPSQTIQLISSFAESIGFPIFASALAGSLRFESPCVVPFAEHVLRNPTVQQNLQPDLILQFGAPLVSTEISKIIKTTMQEQPAHHVLVHPHQSDERADPDFTVSHKVDGDISSFIRALASFIDEIRTNELGSALTPIITLGRLLQKEMPKIVADAAADICKKEKNNANFSEPELMIAIAKTISKRERDDISLFLSNSMPIRDAEAFLYPIGDRFLFHNSKSRIKDIGVNRGASGIDGIISSASGFSEATDRPTTLLIGDVATLHDLNSFHGLRAGKSTKDTRPLTTIVLNNDGGGIFSFLPISDHGSEVSFEEFFGTPTNNFDFRKGIQAFGLPCEKVNDVVSFEKVYSRAQGSDQATVIEAVLAPRDQNVQVHREITRRTNEHIESILKNENIEGTCDAPLPTKRYKYEDSTLRDTNEGLKTLVLLHGWLGDKTEWDEVAGNILKNMKSGWNLISIDLPGHGESPLHHSSPQQLLRSCLDLDDETDVLDGSITGLDAMAQAVDKTLVQMGLTQIDAIAGYSLGGRVALAMKRSSLVSADMNATRSSLMSEETKVILVSAYPGNIRNDIDQSTNQARLEKDDFLSSTISSLSNKSILRGRQGESILLFSKFLNEWYDAPMWGSLRKSSKFEQVIAKRSASLAHRGKDLGAILRHCSPPRCRSDDWRGVEPTNTLYISGGIDEKYTMIGRVWSKTSSNLNIEVIEGKGHALLLEAPEEVAESIINFLESEGKPAGDAKNLPQDASVNSTSDEAVPFARFVDNVIDTSVCGLESMVSVASLDFEQYVIDFADERSQGTGVSGIGWGEKAEARSVTKQRKGFVVQVMSVDGVFVGVGEVSPLPGLHSESITEAEQQLNEIAFRISNMRSDNVFSFEARCVLALEGALEMYLNQFVQDLGIDKLYNSVRAGLEMALLSLASQVVRSPLHLALGEESPSDSGRKKLDGFLSLNGLITRGSAAAQMAIDNVSGKRTKPIQYDSWKVKVGHQSAYEDAMAISYAYQVAKSFTDGEAGKVRADANRGFNESTALHFASILEGIDSEAFKRLEYVEEPLLKTSTAQSEWSFRNQMKALESWYKSTGIPYALDESLSDLAETHNYNFDSMASDIKNIFAEGSHGCAALILKPSLLGLELSMRLARFARMELGVGAVFTSSFESGVGLAFVSFLASQSDASPAKEGVIQYTHGLSTFSLLADDCITPSFGSYVNRQGKLNVASLSRAFYGLGLDELRCLLIEPLSPPELTPRAVTKRATEEMFQRENLEFPDEFEASTATSSDGREIRVVASLPLPFSAEVACARFTDLPQQPRWSPWISSVAYVDARSETEWTLRIRGVNFRWRAKSSLLSEPFPGIRWKSISGLKNTGVVEFIPTDDGSSLMKVQIMFVMPRILSPLFRGTSIFFEDFLRNKVLKWSLEMFRDVVKGDLALEEGNIELGDALFGSVEGKATAIEATFSNPIDTD